MRDKRRSQRVVAGLASGQFGVVSGEQLGRLGYSRHAIARGVRAGWLHPIHHGIYAVGHTALSRHGQCLAAVLSCGNGALLSHRSAAWLWGLTDRWRHPAEVTATSPRETRSDIRIHSATALRDEDRDSSSGIPVTAVPRTLLDIAAVDHPYLGAALSRASRHGLLDLIALDALVTRSRGFRGVARLRNALAIHRTPGFTRSDLERRFLMLIARAGLPRPSSNVRVAGYELDVYWPSLRFAIELDTYDYHGDRWAFEKDRIRQEDLKLAGIEIVRVTGVRLDREPTAVMHRLQQLLTQRKRELKTNAPR
jgi:very-short-patch-repair endonuclease